MLTNLTARNNYLGSGSPGPFSYSFYVESYAELRITRRSASGLETTLVYPTDFSATGAGNTAGGTITLNNALAIGEALSICRVLPLTQPIDLQNQGAYYRHRIERALDRLVKQIQQLDDAVKRAVRLSASYDPALLNMELPPPVADRVLGWNSDGTRLTNLAGGGSADVTDLEARLDALESAPFLPYSGARILNGQQLDFPPDYRYGAFVVLNGDVQPPKIELWANAPFQQPYRLAAQVEPTTPEDETPSDNVATNVVLREVALPPNVRPIETAFTLQMPATTRAGNAVPVFDPETDELVMDVDPVDAVTLDSLRAGITGNPLLIQAMAGIWSIDVGGGIGLMGGNALKCMFTPENYRNVLENEFTETTGPLCMSFWFRTTPGADLTTGDAETNPFGVKFMRVQRHTGTYSQTAFANLNGPDRGNGSGVQVRLEPTAANLRLATGDSSLSEGLPFGEPVGSGFPVMSTELWSYLNDGDWHQVHMEILTGPLGYEMFWFDSNLVVDSRIETTKIIQDRSFDGYMRLHFPANLVIAPPTGDPGFAFYYDKIRAWRKGVL